ncbi:MAG TPA: MFS transporter [Stellaceae bacterium]|nr:MFS transporter [Stellaceae bacterium]
MVSSETAERVDVNFRWKVVRFAFVLAVFGWGIGFYGPSVFLDTLHQERGWPVALVSLAVTAHFLFSALFVAYLPEAYGRWGIARVTQAGVGCTALGAILWGNALAPWQLFPIAIVSGAGSAATTGAAINAIVAPWFDRERPKALSIAFNGASIGGLIFTPLWVTAIGGLGFAAAAAVLGGIAVAVLWPLCGQYLQPLPPAAGVAQPTSALSKTALLRDREFVTISAAFALGLFAQVGLFAHLVTRLAPTLGADGAALSVSLVTVCAVLGRSLFRRLLRDDNRRRIAALNFLVQAIGTALLALSDGALALLCGCILFGLGVGNLVSLPPLIIQKEFAAADIGKAVALTVAINQAVFAFAPAVLGSVRDFTGGYVWPFVVAAAIQLVSAGIVLVGRRPQQLVVSKAPK